MIFNAPLLGQLLLKANLITEEQLKDALKFQKQQGKRLGSILVQLGHLTEETLITFLSRQYSAPCINLKEHKIDTTLLKLIPYDTAKKYEIFPVSKEGSSLRIAMTDPSNNFAIDDIRFITGMKVATYIASEMAISDAIERYYPKKEKAKVSVAQPKEEIHIGGVENLEKIIGSAMEDVSVIEDKEEDTLKEIDAPIVKLVNGMMLNAVKSRASDIHVEPSEEMVQVRYRVDGVLQQVLKLPTKIKNTLTSRIKILAHMDISERRLPQDGRIKLKIGGNKQIDFRVSTIPTQFGEKVVLRILDRAGLQLDLANLGFDERPLKEFLAAIEKPYGMILVTGPTGSGKTTTLYSALSILNKPGVNIMTAEDPIEYSFFGINQVQTKEDIGLSFAVCLRSFLRQDPDIILVGEIRDFETAEIAVKAALTGHLVLSTLHTNDAPSTVTRLINMGIEPFLVSSSVIMVVAQRLIRRICENCKEPIKVTDSALKRIGVERESLGEKSLYVGRGCADCGHTGYKGRLAIYEVMPVREELGDLILQGASALEIKREAVRLGMATLRQSGLSKMIEGVTTMEEVARVTFEN